MAIHIFIAPELIILSLRFAADNVIFYMNKSMIRATSDLAKNSPE